VNRQKGALPVATSEDCVVRGTYPSRFQLINDDRDPNGDYPKRDVETSGGRKFELLRLDDGWVVAVAVGLTHHRQLEEIPDEELDELEGMIAEFAIPDA
jgi:hypothetical protein